jgi:hypothetical protein
MSNIKNRSEVNHLIGSIVSKQPINKNISHLLLAILCKDRKKLGVFIEKTVPNLTSEVFMEEEIDYKPLLDSEQKSKDLFIRTELYKLKEKGYVNFVSYKKDRYNVQANLKGLEYCKSLLLNLMVDDGLNINSIEVVEDFENAN